MPTYENDVQNALSALETDEVRERILKGLLTPEAHAVAIRLLEDRGAPIQDLPSSPPDPNEDQKNHGFLSACMSGEAPLWKAFWMLGITIAIPVSVLNLLSRGSPIVSLLVAIPAQAMWTVAVWRCTFRSSGWIWGILARGWVALLWIAIVGALFRVVNGI